VDHEWIKIQSDLEINVTPINTLAPLLPASSLSLEAGRIKHAGLSSRWATIYSAAVVKQATFNPFDTNNSLSLLVPTGSSLTMCTIVPSGRIWAPGVWIRRNYPARAIANVLKIIETTKFSNVRKTNRPVVLSSECQIRLRDALGAFATRKKVH
jgi:hypothetical protein